MATEVLRGSKEEQICAGCGRPITPKVPHIRTGGTPFKRYHKTCFETKLEKPEAEKPKGKGKTKADMVPEPEE